VRGSDLVKMRRVPGSFPDPKRMEKSLREFALWMVATSLICLGCGRGEIKGAYEVDLEIAGASAPIVGTLVLSNRTLDLPSSAYFDLAPEVSDADAIGLNSCFILDPIGGSRSGEPGLARAFTSRFESDGIRTPIEILNAGDLRIVITRLDFFMGAVGGELEVHTTQGMRPGRIHGTQSGEASADRCVEALAAFESHLGEALEDDALEN
jgi:hypothetical protein